MSLAEVDAALRQAMDDDFDGPTRPCGAPARPHVANPEAPKDAAAGVDAALLAAMDGMDCGAPACPVSHGGEDEASTSSAASPTDASAIDAALLAAMDGMDGSERQPDPSFSFPFNPTPTEPRSMGYLSLPDGASAALMMPPPFGMPPPSASMLTDDLPDPFAGHDDE